MEELVALLITFGLITIVGHGIWVFVAFLLRQISGGEPKKETEITSLSLGREQRSFPARVCYSCAKPLVSDGQYCTSCGRRQPERADVTAGSGAKNHLLADLRVTARQLDRFRNAGAIDEMTYARLMQVVAAEQQRLAAPPAPATPPQPALVPPPPPAPTEPPVKPEVLRPVAVPPRGAERKATPAQGTRVPATSEAEAGVSAPPARPVKVRPFAAPVVETPRKSLAELLAAFMEEKNIRWGELVGGLLIIGCSAALVVSLWARIEQVPLLKFLIFTAMTGAFAGLGLYSEHRWKLPRTSRGLLVTATSLVPLNFLAIAAFSNASAPNSFSVVASEAISLALFFVLTDRAGAVILPGWRKPLTLGVVGTSATQLVARRFAGPDAPTAVLYLLAALPLVSYWLAAALTLRRVQRHDELEAKQAEHVFMLLGVSTFSALVAFGLLLFKSQQVAWTLQRLSPVVSLLALPALFGGLMLWRRTAKLETNEEHFTSVWVAVGGAAAALAGVALGWPHPAGVLPSAVVCCAAFAAVALIFNLTAAHAAALPLFTLASLVGFHVLTGRLAPWADDPALIWHALFSKSSGAALTFVFLLFVFGWEQLKRRGRESDGHSYLVAAVAVAGLSLALVTLRGFAEMGVLWVYCFHAAGALYVAWRTGRVELSVAGLGLALVALIQAVALNYGATLAHRWPVTLLAYASLALAAFAVLRLLISRQGEDARAKAGELFSRPLQHAALIASVAAALTLLRASFSAGADALAATTLWLALVWLALVWLFRSALLFVPFQAALTAGVIFAVAVGLNRWQVLEESAFGAHRVKAYLIAVALLGLAWTALRIALGSVGVSPEGARRLEAEEVGGAKAGWEVGGWKDVVAHVLHPEWPAFDQAALWAALAAFALFSVGGIWPHLTGGSLSAPPPHPVSWLLFAALLVALVARLWERFSRAVVLGLVLLGALLCLLIAGTTGDAATTLRWAAACYLLIGSCVLWLRGPLSRSAARLGWPEMQARAVGLSGAVRAVLLGLTVTPLLGLTLLSAVDGAAFISLSGPLVLLCCTLIGHALRERESASAFAGGLTLNLTVTLGCVVSGGLSIFEPSGVGAVRLAQFNALTCACYGLLWLGARRRLAPRGGDAPPRLDALVTLQVTLGVILNLAVIVPASFKLIAEPSPVAAIVTAAGGMWGWLALVTAGTATAWAKRFEGAKLRLSALCLGALAVSLLAADTISRRDRGDWLGYHALAAAGIVVAFLPALILGGKRLWFDRAGAAELGAGRWAVFINSVRPAEVASWSLGSGSFATLLGLRALFGDPQAPSWTIGTFGAMSVLAIALAGVTLKRAYLYVACLFANAAATVWFLFRTVPATPDDGLHLVEVNLIALGAVGLAFFAFEKWGLAARGLKLSDDLPALHRTAAFGSLIGAAALMVTGVVNSLTAQSACGLFGTATGWLALAATAAVMTACLYDREERHAAMGIYLLSLVLTGAALDAMNVRPERFAWVSLMVCAIYAVVTGLLWAGRERVAEWAALAGVPRREASGEGAQNHWLVTAGLLLIAAAMLLAFSVVLSEPQLWLRVSAAVAVLAQVITAALTTRGEPNEGRRRRRQLLTLWLAAAGLTLFGWSWVAAGAVSGWANRAAILMVVTMGFAEVWGFRQSKLFTPAGGWAEAARRSAAWFFVCGALALAVTVGAEVAARSLPGGAGFTPAASVAVGMALLALSARAVSFALKAELDPLRLSERGRMNYVYAAEALLAGAYLHTRLMMPWLFSGYFQRVWPLVVMALAFVGVGLSELFRRRGQDVLAEPLARTGVFLPLLPALGYWLVDSEVHYTGLMMTVGLFYALEAVLRRSLGASLLACLAVNGGLWHLLVTWDGYGLLERPQLWLSPLAFSLLIAAHLNRERLSAAQMANLRYAALAMLYASSTAEIFIGGVADSPWQPLVLMALAAAGVACGMMLRVRAFLYLGTSFTLVAVLTMIRFAQVNFGWTWLWYVTGIALGLTIILLFALFEKKRDDLMRLVEGLRSWEA